jgi:hypothetical protein
MNRWRLCCFSHVLGQLSEERDVRLDHIRDQGRLRVFFVFKKKISASLRLCVGVRLEAGNWKLVAGSW